MEIAGKAAVVTGSGGAGSGRAVAKLIARNGGQVVVSDIDERGGVTAPLCDRSRAATLEQTAFNERRESKP